MIRLQLNTNRLTVVILLLTLVYGSFLVMNIIIQNRKSIEAKNLEVLDVADALEVVEEEMSVRSILYLRKISDYFKTSTAYLNPDFTYDDFCKDLGIDKKELSTILNKEIHISFYHLLALKRVEVAKTLIKAHSEKFTLEYIMVESGFQSKSTFNRNFKQIVGVTPSEYRENILKNESDV